MREIHDQPDCDVGWADRNSVDAVRDAPSWPDRPPEAGRRAVVRDAPERTALSLEYEQKVKAAYAAYAALREPEVRDDRFSLPESPARRAARMAGEVELPARVRDLPGAREVMPNADRAEIDTRKFSDYSLNPDHPGNNGKADGWRALGYDVDSQQARSEAAEDIRELIRDGLLVNGKVAETRDSPFGPKYTVLSGFTGPNGRHSTLITCWLADGEAGHAVPRLVTTWVQPHRNKETGNGHSQGTRPGAHHGGR